MLISYPLAWHSCASLPLLAPSGGGVSIAQADLGLLLERASSVDLWSKRICQTNLPNQLAKPNTILIIPKVQHIEIGY
jgi:hypothetical protein